MKTIITMLLACTVTGIAYAQNTIKGKVTNQDKESLSSISIMVKGTNEGTFTDNSGYFSISTKKPYPLVLEITGVGFQQYEQQVTKSEDIKVTLQAETALMDAVVMAPIRAPIRSLQSPVTIENLSLKMIEATPSLSAHDGLANLKGVDVTTSSLTFKTPSTRGFNYSGSARVNQLVDGMDNQAPGMNFFVGNLVGPTELDIESIELLPGASSALYGAGGMNGTILINSKNPFKYQGLSIQVKEGLMNVDKEQRGKANLYNEWSLRYAKALGNRVALKVGAQYLKATDWLANDSLNYSRAGDLGKVIPGTRSSDPNYDGVNVYGDETTTDIKPLIPEPFRTILPLPATINVSRTGYAEKDIVDPEVKNLKLSGALHYKLTSNLEASLAAYWAKGTSVYTGSDRYSLKNVKIGQYKIELKSSNWFLRGYTTQEDAGDSYAATTITRYFNEAWKPSNPTWYTQYVGAFLQSYATGMNYNEAHSAARAFADQGRPEPHSTEFNQIMDNLKKIPISKGGGLFLDKSDLWMAEGQYNLSSSFKFAEVIIGGNYKKYILNSQGTIFIDTAGTIPIYELGGYIQATKKLFNEHLVLSASERLDKNENFKGKLTPRFTGLIKVAENSNIRLSYQTAYRFPTTQQQFIKLQVGTNVFLLGGLPWIQEYTNPKGGPSYIVPSMEAYHYKEFKPETSNSYEIGYKGLIAKKILIDVYGYLSHYRDFLGRMAVYEPGAQNYYSIVVNSDNKVKTDGYGLGMNYLFSKSYTATANFYSDEITNVPTGFVAGYNTPKYRFNAGLSNAGLGKHKKFAFAIQYRWQDAFRFENDFANGDVAAFSTLDAQVSYKILKNKVQLRIGGTNLLNHYYKNGYGMPTVGGLYYASLRLDVL
jgi:outer membrane receptor protein involved in Fe transport